MGGELVQVLRYPALVRPVDQAELDSLGDEHRRLARAAGTIILEGIFEPEAQPERRPSFGRMLTSPSGWIWIGEFVPRRDVPRL